jgi:hypothetical protein
MSDRNPRKNPWYFAEILEHEIKEYRPGFNLIGFSYQRGLLTGYFMNPADPAYVHIWQILIDRKNMDIYSATLREVMLVPVDNYRFPHAVILLKKPGELQKLGFDTPEFRDVIPLRLEDAEWRYLCAIKDDLMEHAEGASYILDPPVFRAYMRALSGLQEALGDY